ncbi:MAG: diaminopimelate epimerase [bacterium]|nr:diaminopimelate epimerase [Candidatus Sumerlaeota bacterium]
MEFYKMSGAGNDFIVINNLDLHVPEAGRRELFSKWCRRGLSVGADGVILIEPSDEADFRMRYYNSDGGEAETCGNGSRCIARFAHEQGVAPASMTFQTLAGPYRARALENGETVVWMTDARGIRENIRITGALFTGEAHFINTGVPHAVVFVEDLDGFDVFGVGMMLRHHAEFAPAGANANFVRVRGRHDIDIRTYERGVENETLACGTGSIASAVIAARRGVAEPPVRFKTAGGETLTIGFQLGPGGARDVTLQGGAVIVFRGYIKL